MYVPKHFEVSEWAEITGFVARARAADLVTVDSAGLPVATLMPAFWDTSAMGESNYGSLVMHMARANPQWKSIEPGSLGLAIVHGPQAYISPSNYEGKLTDHKVVPTWNYQAVHVYGSPRIVSDHDEVYKILSHLTARNESNPSYRVETLPQDFVEKEMKGIVAFQIEVTKIEANYKLSQNRDDEDYYNIVSRLEERGDEMSHGVAEAMKEKRPS